MAFFLYNATAASVAIMNRGKMRKDGNSGIMTRPELRFDEDRLKVKYSVVDVSFELRTLHGVRNPNGPPSSPLSTPTW
jgi:hypothetical protein